MGSREIPLWPIARSDALALGFIAPDAVLRDAKRLTDGAWYVLPALGPRRSDVRSLEIAGSPEIRLPR